MDERYRLEQRHLDGSDARGEEEADERHGVPVLYPLVGARVYDAAMDLFSATPSTSKDLDDGLFAALGGGNGNDDMSDINAYIQSQSANDGGLFD